MHLVAIARKILLGADLTGLATQFLDRLDLLVTQFGSMHEAQQECVEHVLAPWSVAGIAPSPIWLRFSRSKVTLPADSMRLIVFNLQIIVGAVAND